MGELGESGAAAGDQAGIDLSTGTGVPSVWRFGTVNFNFCCSCGIMLLSPKTHFDDQACVT